MELTDKQIFKANEWLLLHKDHIKKLIQSAKTDYPPTNNEDKNNPSLWKGEHWYWFLKTGY